MTVSPIVFFSFSLDEEGCSPPKRDCINTPTQLLNHLTVKSPSKSPSPTKKQNCLCPKELFSKGKHNIYEKSSAIKCIIR